MRTIEDVFFPDASDHFRFEQVGEYYNNRNINLMPVRVFFFFFFENKYRPHTLVVFFFPRGPGL